MSRVEKFGEDKAMAFGVDFGFQPGTPCSFVQVWDTTEDEKPCNEGDEGFNNVLVNEWDVPEERVVALAREHNIPLDPCNVWEAFD